MRFSSGWYSYRAESDSPFMPRGGKTSSHLAAIFSSELVVPRPRCIFFLCSVYLKQRTNGWRLFGVVTLVVSFATGLNHVDNKSYS